MRVIMEVLRVQFGGFGGKVSLTSTPLPYLLSKVTVTIRPSLQLDGLMP